MVITTRLLLSGNIYLLKLKWHNVSKLFYYYAVSNKKLLLRQLFDYNRSTDNFVSLKLHIWLYDLWQALKKQLNSKDKFI